MINRLGDVLTGVFPALKRAFDYSAHKGALILLTGYQTPAAIRRRGHTRLTVWLAKRQVRSAKTFAATAIAAADAQQTTLPGESVAAQIVAELAPRAILDLDDRIKRLQTQIRDTFRAHPQAEIIESLPGTGPILGAELVVAAGDLRAYADAGHRASAAGLVPVPRDSGRRTGNLHRPKRYSRRLRRVFYLSAQTSIIRDGPNRDFGTHTEVTGPQPAAWGDRPQRVRRSVPVSEHRTVRVGERALRGRPDHDLAHDAIRYWRSIPVDHRDTDVSQRVTDTALRSGDSVLLRDHRRGLRQAVPSHQSAAVPCPESGGETRGRPRAADPQFLDIREFVTSGLGPMDRVVGDGRQHDHPLHPVSRDSLYQAFHIDPGQRHTRRAACENGHRTEDLEVQNGQRQCHSLPGTRLHRFFQQKPGRRQHHVVLTVHPPFGLPVVPLV